MAPKSIRQAITDALDSLEDEDLERFCFQLLDHSGKRVRESQVMGKTRVRITATLVGRYTEKGALKVVVDTLREAGFNQNAKELDEATKCLTSATPNTKSKSKARRASGAASSQPEMAGDKHFIDEHRNELIERVSNVDVILDDLLQKQVIKQGMYDKIRAISTTQDMMRELYSGPLKAGKACKDVLYNSLKKHEQFLMEDLKNE